MANFTGIGHGGGEARRAHLALVDGGASLSTQAAARAASSAVGRPTVVQAEAPTARAAATAYSSRPTLEAPRSRHESGVRAVAKNYDNFADALLPMVLASGVSGEAATSVADAILSNPALKAQAERAFQRARISVA